MRSIAFLVLAIIGLVFSLSGALGIVRMPDLYTRIQCSSKTITMGALPALIALVVGEGIVTSYASRALIVAALLLIVNPAASHALARAAYKSGVPMWPGAVRDEVKDRQEKEQQAKLSDTKLGDTKLSDTKLSDTKLSDTKLSDTKLSDTKHGDSS